MSLYRISRPTGIVAESASGPDARQYFDRALRMIPADVVAAYLTIRGFWIPRDSASPSEDPLAHAVLNWWLPLTGLAATILFRILGTSKTFAGFDDIEWKTVIISGTAFILWVLAVQDSTFGLQLDPRIPPSLLISFTLLAPLLQKGD